MSKVSSATDQFAKAQEKRGWSNIEAAEFFGRSPQTVSNWRHGRQAIPKYVWKLLKAH